MVAPIKMEFVKNPSWSVYDGLARSRTGRKENEKLHVVRISHDFEIEEN